ncbi:MAG TPA: SDR family oxidoreductase [Candidatus Sulfotelmatobacter sp.]|nr:SDR family oxidoreductase [Candidatus Sulfotelmatobacter sp.]
MRTVLVAGAAGGVGEGIVRQVLLRCPELVLIATSRSQARLDALRERLGPVDLTRLRTLVGDVATAQRAEALDAQIAHEFGPLDVAIASLGGWWEGGPFLDVDPPTWDAVMHEMLGTHVHFAQTFVPRLARRPGSMYLGIGGGAAITPVPNAGLVSIAGAAQAMLTRVLAAEMTDVRIVELIANGPVRTYESPPDAPADWISADDVGAVVAALVAGDTPSWPALRKRGPLVIMDPLADRRR